jgi:hypothetical protein
VAHHTGLPTEAGTNQKVVRLRPVLQDFGIIDAEARSSMCSRFREQRIKIELLLERTASKGGDEGLSPGSVRRRGILVVLAIHRVPLSNVGAVF